MFRSRYKSEKEDKAHLREENVGETIMVDFFCLFRKESVFLFHISKLFLYLKKNLNFLRGLTSGGSPETNNVRTFKFNLLDKRILNLK
jgi:hypothetical protein